MVITSIRGLKTLLLTTHEPSSRSSLDCLQYLKCLVGRIGLKYTSAQVSKSCHVGFKVLGCSGFSLGS